MTIIVTGAGGMLGQAVVRVARDINLGERLAPFTHAELDVTNLDRIEEAIALLPKPHTVINCAGIVRGRGDVSDEEMRRVNAKAPLFLSMAADRLVQVSTDCVFSGDPADAPFDERSNGRPTDLYGKTKWQGEYFDPPDVTVRGSFIGFEGGLLAWFLAQPKDATVPGYTDHWWSGGHVDQYAAGLLGIALDRSLTGIVHLVNQPAEGPHADTTKYRVLCDLRDWLRPDIAVEPTEGPDGPRHLILRSTRPEVPTLSWMRDLRCMLRQYNDADLSPRLDLTGWRLKELQTART